MVNNGLDEQLEGYDDMGEDELYYELDDDRRAELNEIVGLKVLGIELWDESIADEEEEQPPAAEERVFVDCDVYFDDNVALELYVAAVYPDPEGGDPVMGVDNIFAAIGRLADENLELVDFGEADEEEGGIALAFGHGDDVQLAIVANAWMVTDWEPDEEGEEDDELEDDEA